MMTQRMHPNTLRSGQVVLVVIDMQEAFRAATQEFDIVAGRIATMVQAARLLGVPTLVTEQVPQKLGRTVKPILDVLPENVRIVDKTAFSSCGAPAFIDQLVALPARQALVCGLESHVCVNQTVHDLLARSIQVHLLVDCVTSRTQENRELGIRKMLASGAVPCGVEMALFELMRDAQHEQFRAVQRLVR